ncbi:MAG: hypothetical protein U0939_13250 [Pirellulales bacterium]
MSLAGLALASLAPASLAPASLAPASLAPAVALHGAEQNAASAGEAVRATAERLQPWLDRTVLVPGQTQEDVQRYVEARVKRLTPPAHLEEWRREAERLRQEMLDQVVFRGVPEAWRKASPRVDWQGQVEAGDGYRIVRLRYEVLPGLWAPALLYEPQPLAEKHPVSLHVNGHDALGKAAPYKQIRCLNLAKRGTLALNIEWLGMGQLRTPGNTHGKLNQLDLCGVAGLAPFYLVMQRGLDVLLQHPQADAQRAAAAGLSGGGWQTIFLSSLDERVTLANPVAGYSSFLTRARHYSDLGDSEQTPSDMGMVADYTHLTALRAPRPTLLTYNVKDECCFASAHALPPLVETARPVFGLWGSESHLRTHVNEVPGTHNFERDNREALYRMLADHDFAVEGRPFPPEEIDVGELVRTADALRVELPADNADLHQLALQAARGLPRSPAFPAAEVADLKPWRQAREETLRELLRWSETTLQTQEVFAERAGDVQVRGWRLRVGQQWSFPVVEFEPPEAKGTTLLASQGGRRTLALAAATELAKGRRVVVLDPFYVGECEIKQRGYLFALLVATVGGRPLGVQAEQIAATANWLANERGAGPVTLEAYGGRTTAAALAATALERQAFSEVRLHEAYGSLHEVLEADLSYEQAPELFCFGLLAEFDLAGLTALAAPTPVRWVEPTERARRELQPLDAWYARLGRDWRVAP